MALLARNMHSTESDIICNLEVGQSLKIFAFSPFLLLQTHLKLQGSLYITLLIFSTISNKLDLIFNHFWQILF